MTFAEKLKRVRKANNMTQAEFADSIGISRGNLSGLEIGKVKPTLLMINCISLMYQVDKRWLLDDNDSDVTAIGNAAAMTSQIIGKYEQLNDGYKKFVESQINQLLEMQGEKP